MRRIRAGTPHACKIDGSERRIHGDVVASVDSDREVFRCAVDYDEIDFRMRNPEPFNHVLHGRPAAHGVMEAVAPPAHRQEIIEPTVEPEPHVAHVPLSVLVNATAHPLRRTQYG